MLEATKKRCSYSVAARNIFKFTGQASISSSRLAAAVQTLGLTITASESESLACNMLSLCTWSSECREAPTDKLVDWLTSPISNFRKVQSKVNVLCRKVPTAVRYYARNKDDKTNVSGLAMLELLLAGPLPISALDSLILVALLARNGRGTNDPAGLESMFVDQNQFLRVCRGDAIIQAPLT